jgi:hypothetical protein
MAVQIKKKKQRLAKYPRGRFSRCLILVFVLRFVFLIVSENANQRASNT